MDTVHEDVTEEESKRESLTLKVCVERSPPLNSLSLSLSEVKEQRVAGFSTSTLPRLSNANASLAVRVGAEIQSACSLLY